MHLNAIGGTIFGYVGPEFVTINVGIDSRTGSVALYKGGWEVAHLLGNVDGDQIKLRVMNRGWFKTKVLLEIEGAPALLETGNKFGDLLRKLLE
jgi:hypothetical protein